MKAHESSRRLILAVLFFSCVTPRPAPEVVGRAQGEETTPVLEVVRGFVEATRGRQFDLVLGLLSARWRSASTVGSLTADFDAEPLALDRLRRIEEALSSSPLLDGGVAELPLGQGRALVLVREEAGWRIDRLE